MNGISIKTSIVGALLGIGVMVGSAADAAVLVAPLSSDADIFNVAQGCGPGWYRGPGGACHRFGYGPYPGGYWGPRPGWGRHCWRGYYGHWHCN
jgi:hypothetical protein